MGSKKHFIKRMIQTGGYIVMLSFVACQNNQNTDQSYYDNVNKDFETVKTLASNRSEALFSVFDQNLSKDEIKYLKFLYAYMPLSDLADYDGDFFLKQVRSSIDARNYFAWGDSIPEDLFRHFVLPYRINNENPDTARQVFYQELKPRIENMSMYDAVLEVNHWCHEKVEYKASDERTIAPLSIVKSAYGRCGEESTFTVTALRAVGIPARQVYTPRWAHCDDNHAWVEVWANGKWYFLGACEPLPKLNRGWFSKPVQRAMMVHTKVFGEYSGSETALVSDKKYTRINVIDTYINPVNYNISIIDDNGNPIDSVDVEFQLYNYAEFYPIAIKKTDKDGKCSISTNHGSLLIHARKNNSFTYAMMRSDTNENDISLNLVLSEKKNKTYIETIDVIVPPNRNIKEDTSGNAENNIRLKKEDEIRKTFVESFATKELANKIALNTGFNAEEIFTHLEMARGNYYEIEMFFNALNKKDDKYTISLLEQIGEKDHRDTESKILIDHIQNSINTNNVAEDIFIEHILNPRVANEMLKAYKGFFQKNIDKELQKNILINPEELINYIKSEIKIDDELNHYHTPLSPIGVFELKISDKWSRNICIVSIYRSLGIPARLEPATKTPQYYFNNNWNTVYFEQQNDECELPKGNLMLDYNSDDDLKYRIHFSIAKFDNGRFNTLDYGWETPISEISNPIPLDTGYYVLITGKRLSNGDVKVNRNFFEINKDEEHNILVELPVENNDYPIIGSVNPESSNTKTRIICWIAPGEEPTKHLLKELALLQSNFKDEQISVLCYSPLSDNTAIYQEFGIDSSWFVYHENKYKFDDIIELKANTSINFSPICIVVDKNNNIRFIHSGYEVGIGEKLLNTSKAIISSR